MTDELFRFRMHRDGPAGFLPCTRDWPHDGPCAHPPDGRYGEFARDYDAWLVHLGKTAMRYEAALPCQDPNCGFRNPICRNCSLVMEATDAIVGPPPHPGDYRDEEDP